MFYRCLWDMFWCWHSWLITHGFVLLSSLEVELGTWYLLGWLTLLCLIQQTIVCDEILVVYRLSKGNFPSFWKYAGYPGKVFGIGWLRWCKLRFNQWLVIFKSSPVVNLNISMSLVSSGAVRAERITLKVQIFITLKPELWPFCLSKFFNISNNSTWSLVECEKSLTTPYFVWHNLLLRHFRFCPRFQS